jgi:GT2 family glycosyltransferase
MITSTSSGSAVGYPGATRRWIGCFRRGSDFELDDVLQEWSETYTAASVLVVAGDSTPLGWVRLDGLSGLSRDELENLVSAETSKRFGDADEPGECPVAEVRGPTCAVVICTRDRPASLARSLTRVMSAAPESHVLVVDNAPRKSCAAVVDKFLAKGLNIERIVELVPGLSRARNRALSVLSEDVVAFIDDDTLVDRNWLRSIVAAFTQHHGVRLVTGLVATAELESEYQYSFERRVGWGQMLGPRIFEVGDPSAVGTRDFYRAGRFGTGANLAVDRQFLLDLGGFDTNLGAGTRARGGEDLDIFVRTIATGSAISRVPSSIVWHVHRSDRATLRHQMFGYGSGLSAFLTEAAVRDGVLPVAKSIVRCPFRAPEKTHGGRRNLSDLELYFSEAIGLAYGPFALWIEKRCRHYDKRKLQ